MDLIKVNYLEGDNENFDYFILDTKENAIEQHIDKNDLAYKVFRVKKMKASIYGQVKFGNFDYLLSKREKGTNNFYRSLLAFKSEVEIIHS